MNKHLKWMLQGDFSKGSIVQMANDGAWVLQIQGVLETVEWGSVECGL